MGRIITHSDDCQGAKGAVREVQPKPARVSSHLAFLRRLVDSGQMTADAAEKAIDFCRRCLDDPDTTPRDRNNAARTLASFTKITADVAAGLHKDDRIDAGHATENVAYNVVIPGVTDDDDRNHADPVPEAT